MMTSTSLHHDRHDPAVAPPVIGGIDHVEWWVGNARSFAALLMSSFGFEAVGYAGPETGRRDRVSHFLQQGRIRFVVTGALGPDSPISEHVRAHGDGVKDICFLVDDAEAAYAAAIARGAVTERPPAIDSDQLGAIHQAAIRTYGETVHTFLDRSAYTGHFAPGFGPAVLPTPRGDAVGLTRFDHIVGNVELGHLGEWVDYYREVLGFDQLVHFGDDQISTEYSALMSTVVWNHDKVVLPINEPAEGRRKSQIEEYLDYYHAPGVQHLALHTPDIVHAVRTMRERGVRFLEVPPEYYVDAASAWPASICPGRRWPSSASWSTATRTVTCCRSSPRRCAIGPLCSSRSSNAREPRASAPATSRHCSRRSSARRPLGGTCRQPPPQSAGVGPVSRCTTTIDPSPSPIANGSAGPSGAGELMPSLEASIAARVTAASRCSTAASCSSPSVACSRRARACATNGASSAGSGSGVVSSSGVPPGRTGP